MGNYTLPEAEVHDLICGATLKNARIQPAARLAASAPPTYLYHAVQSDIFPALRQGEKVTVRRT